MHDSYTPLGGLVPMWLMQLGEVVFGGVGSGLYGMLVFAIIAVFIAGLMVGRTPEYLGKKIEAYEMKMASLVILIPPFVVLVGAALAVVIEPGASSMSNPGVHGFSQVLYAFSSAGNNNGSAFAGLSANTPFYNSALGVAMWLSRYWLVVPVLAIAGSLAAKKFVPASSGTLPTHTPLFVGLLIGTVLLVGALTFVPALALGPIVEHLMLFCREVGRTKLTNDCSAQDTQVRTFDPALMRQAAGRFAQAPDADGAVAQSGDVRHLARRAADHASIAIVDRDGFTAAISVVAVVHGAVRQLRRSAGRRARQGAGGEPARRQAGHAGRQARRHAPRCTRAARSARARCARATWCWSRPASSCRATATSSTASPRSTNRRSPASRRRWCARPAAIARRSPAARACCPTGWSCASPPIRATASSTA